MLYNVLRQFERLTGVVGNNLPPVVTYYYYSGDNCINPLFSQIIRTTVSLSTNDVVLTSDGNCYTINSTYVGPDYSVEYVSTETCFTAPCPTTTTTTTTIYYYYYNAYSCNGSPVGHTIRSTISLSLSDVVLVDDSNCYTITSVVSGPSYYGDYISNEACFTAPCPTTTTTSTTTSTTTAAPTYYYYTGNYTPDCAGFTAMGVVIRATVNSLTNGNYTRVVGAYSGYFYITAPNPGTSYTYESDNSQNVSCGY